MSYVATLISHPDRPAVTEGLAERLAQLLPQGRVAGWLAPGVAMDVLFSGDAENGAGADIWLKKHARSSVICRSTLFSRGKALGAKSSSSPTWIPP
jgi:hypothetical protein